MIQLYLADDHSLSFAQMKEREEFLKIASSAAVHFYLRSLYNKCIVWDFDRVVREERHGRKLV